MQNKKLPIKIKLLYYLSIFEFPKNPLSGILTKISEISSINFSNEEELYFLLINKKNISNMLYVEDKVINIPYNDKTKYSIDYFFYLSLILNEDTNLTDYKFSVEHIKYLYNYQKSINNNNKYKKIIIAKIIIRLINYYIYIGLDDFNKDIDIYLKKILKENKDFVKGNINTFNELGLNFDEKYCIKTELDVIYSDIILAFLKKQMLYNIKYEHLILIQLELKSIKLTNIMIEKLSKELNVENKNFKKYKINNEKDLYNEEVINFYYILLKFIFKNNIFIYHFHFLLNFRIIMIKIINSKTILKLNEDNKDKLEYIIKRITDSDYYFNKYLKYNIFEPLKSILTYYKNYLFESKKEEINSIEKIIKNNTNDKACTKYLQDYEKAQIMNLKFPVINYFFLQKNNTIEKTENELNVYVNIWENIEKKIKENKFNEIDDKNKQILFNYLDNENNKEIFKNIIGEKNFKILYLEFRDYIYDEESKIYNEYDEVASNDDNKKEISNFNENENISEISNEKSIGEDNFLSEQIFDSKNDFDIESFGNISTISLENSNEDSILSSSSFNDDQLDNLKFISSI